MAGTFISLDGVDGGGKSTQVRLLETWLQERGFETLALRDPGGTQLGEAVRELLLHRQEIPLSMTAEMLLYMASRAQLVAEIIEPALRAGKIVISDRFLLANVVYQGCAGGLPIDSIWQVGSIATGGLCPRLTLVLDLDAEAAMSRLDGGLDRLESRGLEYMRRVRDGFIEQSQRLVGQVEIIDATEPMEQVHEKIVAAVQAILPTQPGNREQ